jgi:hypothetical protein
MLAIFAFLIVNLNFVLAVCFAACLPYIPPTALRWASSYQQWLKGDTSSGEPASKAGTYTQIKDANLSRIDLLATLTA